MPNPSAMSRATWGVAVAVRASTRSTFSCAGQPGDLEVVGPEVVPPLADAVGLVDRQQRDLPPLERSQKPLVAQPLGRDVQQLQPAGVQTRREPASVSSAIRLESSRAGRAPRRHEKVELVLHQRDQRRDDQRQPVEQQRPATGSRGSCRRRWERWPAPTGPPAAARSPPPAPCESGRSRTLALSVRPAASGNATASADNELCIETNSIQDEERGPRRPSLQIVYRSIYYQPYDYHPFRCDFFAPE